MRILSNNPTAPSFAADAAGGGGGATAPRAPEWCAQHRARTARLWRGDAPGGFLEGTGTAHRLGTAYTGSGLDAAWAGLELSAIRYGPCCGLIGFGTASFADRAHRCAAIPLRLGSRAGSMCADPRTGRRGSPVADRHSPRSPRAEHRCASARRRRLHGRCSQKRRRRSHAPPGSNARWNRESLAVRCAPRCGSSNRATGVLRGKAASLPRVLPMAG